MSLFHKTRNLKVDLVQINKVSALGLACQELTNYDPWVKSSPLTIFVNKILLEHSLVHFSNVLPVAALMLEWQSCDKDHMALKA